MKLDIFSLNISSFSKTAMINQICFEKIPNALKVDGEKDIKRDKM
jgi:hypothetical protein